MVSKDASERVCCLATLRVLPEHGGSERPVIERSYLFEFCTRRQKQLRKASKDAVDMIWEWKHGETGRIPWLLSKDMVYSGGRTRNIPREQRDGLSSHAPDGMWATSAANLGDTLWKSGPQGYNSLKATSGNTCELADSSYSGILQPSGEVPWSDGDIWKRCEKQVCPAGHDEESADAALSDYPVILADMPYEVFFSQYEGQRICTLRCDDEKDALAQCAAQLIPSVLQSQRLTKCSCPERCVTPYNERLFFDVRQVKDGQFHGQLAMGVGSNKLRRERGVFLAHILLARLRHASVPAWLESDVMFLALVSSARAASWDGSPYSSVEQSLLDTDHSADSCPRVSTSSGSSTVNPRQLRGRSQTRREVVRHVSAREVYDWTSLTAALQDLRNSISQADAGRSWNIVWESMQAVRSSRPSCEQCASDFN